MKKALVLGASGGMGYSIVKELTSRGFNVTAFARTRTKLERLYKNDNQVSIVTGDIFNINDLLKASNGVDIIFQAANIPYPEWQEKLPTFIGNIVHVAETKSIKLAIVDNIYAYGRSAGTKVTEDYPKNPHTKKGKVRLKVENMIKQSNVQALIAHFPDFYGPNAENTILHFTLNNIVKNKRTSFVGDTKIAREYIFTPDGAKAIVNLAMCEDSYGQNWNIPGHDVITGEDIMKIICEITSYNKKVSIVTKNMIRFLGLFNKNMHEVVEMFYLNEEPVFLSGRKYEELMGPIPRTPYKDGLRQTVEYMKANQS
jgi:nucleoside-diphosphate-sugar epimerase